MSITAIAIACALQKLETNRRREEKKEKPQSLMSSPRNVITHGAKDAFHGTVRPIREVAARTSQGLALLCRLTG